MQKAFGPALGHEDGKFSHVTAVTDGDDSGARHIYAVHTDAGGVERGYEVMDETGYFHADDNQRAAMQEIQTDDGARFFAREVSADDVREVSKETVSRIERDDHSVSIQDSPENVATYGPLVDDDDAGDFDEPSSKSTSGTTSEGPSNDRVTVEEEPILGETQQEKRDRQKKKWDPERDK